MVLKNLSQKIGVRDTLHEIEKYREGTYHILTFVAENAAAVDEFGRLSRIDGQILRSMTVKLDK